MTEGCPRPRSGRLNDRAGPIAIAFDLSRPQPILVAAGLTGKEGVEMYRIRRFGIVQTATMFAVIYIVVIALFAIPAALIVGLSGASSSEGNSSAALGVVVVALIVAVVYGLIGWVFTAIACALYNVVAGWVGGIEVQIDPVAPPPAPPTWGPITQSAPPPSPPAPPTWGPPAQPGPPPSPPAPSE